MTQWSRTVITAAGEVRQASCSKRLHKLSLRACSTFLCFR